jgi:hypothetical protein
MISILILATILVTIAALMLFEAKKALEHKIAVLENKSSSLDIKNQICTSAYNDLEKANIQFQVLNKKLTNELQLWKYRRKLLKEVPVSFHKKKIRGKKGKAQK